MSKLVIVESPAKAKTISRFLGNEYEVQASYGHVRDLPENADEIPAQFKKEKWARLGVNVDNGFEPIYVVPGDKKRHVDSLKKASKQADELLLATDEDREGESISWHVLQLLKPNKKTPVKRIVFHEITKEAIEEALRHPREVDENVVKAQETRRILDRLYGYTLSPLLWKKVAPRLSAGRVQSVAVRLIVDRERQRRSFHAADYWDLEAFLETGNGMFTAQLKRVDQQKISSGASFDPDTGLLKDNSLLIDQNRAETLVSEARPARPWSVASIESKPGQESPPQPFMTSTLQQEANRKLRMSSKRTMQVAQGLYEGVELKGERVGLITYMRTDSLTLAEKALQEARKVIEELYGKDYLPANPVRYKTKAKSAQEAHEAIRPTDLSKRPQDVRKYLDDDQFALYELIWKRTIACQMLPAKVLRTTTEVSVSTQQHQLIFGASGKQITFPGFLKAYVEGSDDPDATLDSKESILPPLKQGQELDLIDLKALKHTTKPPARYTEASLVKRLEEEGVGRPSTYASIISTIQDRGYVFKRGNELIPTFTAFAVTELLEQHFSDLVDLTFTAKMEDELDEIAEGKRDWVGHLNDFYHGKTKESGLVSQVEQKANDIPFPAIPLGPDSDGRPVVIRVGRFGTFVQRGEGGAGHTANVPNDMAPADLTLEQALALIDQKGSANKPVAHEPASGRAVYYKTGRFGNYLEVEQTEEEQSAGEKPKRVTLPAKVTPDQLNEEELIGLVSLPRTLGIHPETGEPVIATVGPYGGYVRSGEIRNLEDWRQVFTITLDEALVLLSQPRVRGRRAANAQTTPKTAIKEFDGIKVMEGRYGPYVTNGKINATLPKGLDPQEITVERALELIEAKAAAPARSKTRRAWGAKKTTSTASRTKATTRKKKG